MRFQPVLYAFLLACASTGSHEGDDDPQGGFECGADPCVPHQCFCNRCGEADMRCVRQSWAQENAVDQGDYYRCEELDCAIVEGGECPAYTCSCTEGGAEGECIRDGL